MSIRPNDLPKRAWPHLLALAEVVRAEEHRPQSYRLDEDGYCHVRGGAYANGDREALGYTGANVKDARNVLMQAGFRVNVGDAEGYLQAALYALDDGEEAKLPASDAERKQKSRDEAPEGACRTCRKPAERGKYCDACKHAANERQRRARRARKGE